MPEGETVEVPAELLTRLMAAIETPGDLTGDDTDHLLEDAARYVVESVQESRSDEGMAEQETRRDWYVRIYPQDGADKIASYRIDDLTESEAKTEADSIIRSDHEGCEYELAPLAVAGEV